MSWRSSFVQPGRSLISISCLSVSKVHKIPVSILIVEFRYLLVIARNSKMWNSKGPFIEISPALWGGSIPEVSPPAADTETRGREQPACLLRLGPSSMRRRQRVHLPRQPESLARCSQRDPACRVDPQAPVTLRFRWRYLQCRYATHVHANQ